MKPGMKVEVFVIIRSDGQCIYSNYLNRGGLKELIEGMEDGLEDLKFAYEKLGTHQN